MRPLPVANFFPRLSRCPVNHVCPTLRAFPPHTSSHIRRAIGGRQAVSRKVIMSATPSTTQQFRPTSAPPAQSTRLSGKRANVFICFAPEERDFARDLDDELRKRRRISAIDWLKEEAATTSAGADVLQRIEAADTFVFIVSPSSVASEVCRKQLEHAVRLRKVIVPVQRAEVATENLPASLAVAASTRATTGTLRRCSKRRCLARTGSTRGAPLRSSRSSKRPAGSLIRRPRTCASSARRAPRAE